MECPKCYINFAEQPKWLDYLGPIDINDTSWNPMANNFGMKYAWAASQNCPDCNEYIAWMFLSEKVDSANRGENKGLVPGGERERIFIYPIPVPRRLPAEVPAEFAADFKEAALILRDSPRASAALSRRCLQRTLKEQLKVSGGDLYSQINDALKNNHLPATVENYIHVVRQIGNAGAHPPAKDGNILDVEPWEAEWCLDLLEQVFDYIFVKPAQNAARLQRYKNAQKTAGTP